MVKLEEITTIPTFSKQLENKILYSNHADDISIRYKSTYTIKYVIDGVKKYSNGNQDIELSQGEYLILNNDSRITTEAKKGAKGLSFFLSKHLIDEINAYHNVDSISPRFLEVARKNTTDSTGLFLKEAALLFENDLTEFSYKMDQLFIQISEQLIEEQARIDNRFAALRIVKHHTKKELFKQINLTKEYLNDNLQKHITLDLLSRDIGLSKYYLHRLFKEVVGCSPLNYLKQIRLQKAILHLKSTDHSILEIALACGFDELAYFSNTFKKHIGISPTDFRKSI